MIRYRLTTVPGIGAINFDTIDDALGGAKTLLEEPLSVSIKIMKENTDEQRTETRQHSDAESGEPAGGTAGTGPAAATGEATGD